MGGFFAHYGKEREHFGLPGDLLRVSLNALYM